MAILGANMELLAYIPHIPAFFDAYALISATQVDDCAAKLAIQLCPAFD
jgi:hypothetical protein